MSVNSVFFMLVYIVCAPFVGGLLDGFDRKISARMQGRRGPSIFQPFYDVRKLFNKQILVVNQSQFFMVLSYLFFVAFSGALVFGGFDLLLCFFSLTTAAMFLLLASYSTHSPFGSLGSQRELLQMMAYEPMVLLTAVGFYLATGTFNVSGILNAARSPIIELPGFFIGFVFILTIKIRKSPFDLSTAHHAHQEMVKGITTEMVGGLYAVVEIAEWYENVFLLSIVGLFFVNSNPLSILLAIVMCLIVMFIEIIIDNASARFKWDKVLGWAWLVTLVTGGINLLILEML